MPEENEFSKDQNDDIACKTLVIVGNGFDIAHGIESRYSDFRTWLKNNKNYNLISN